MIITTITIGDGVDLQFDTFKSFTSDYHDVVLQIMLVYRASFGNGLDYIFTFTVFIILANYIFDYKLS